jgi:hypothetical protein
MPTSASGATQVRRLCRSNHGDTVTVLLQFGDRVGFSLGQDFAAMICRGMPT